MSKRFDPDRRPVVDAKLPVLAERTLLRQASEELADPKCPRCGHRLVARLGRLGPYFHCGCELERKRSPTGPR